MPSRAQGVGWMARRLWVGLPCLWTSAEEALGGRQYQPCLQVCLASHNRCMHIVLRSHQRWLESGARQLPQAGMPAKVHRYIRTWAACDGEGTRALQSQADSQMEYDWDHAGY